MSMDLDVKYPSAEQRESLMTKYIKIDSSIRSGAPCLAGTRLSFSDVIDIAKARDVADYNLSEEQIDACSLFARAFCIKRKTNSAL